VASKLEKSQETERLIKPFSEVKEQLHEHQISSSENRFSPNLQGSKSQNTRRISQFLQNQMIKHTIKVLLLDSYFFYFQPNSGAVRDGHGEHSAKYPASWLTAAGRW
jgi:hypothetical protein